MKVVQNGTRASHSYCFAAENHVSPGRAIAETAKIVHNVVNRATLNIRCELVYSSAMCIAPHALTPCPSPGGERGYRNCP